MNTTTTSASAFHSSPLPDSAPASARAVFRLLKRLRHGSLDVQLPDGGHVHFGQAQPGGLRAAIRLRNWSACKAALRSGDIGFAESFIAGDWTSPDIASLLQLLLLNRHEI